MFLLSVFLGPFPFLKRPPCRIFQTIPIKPVPFPFFLIFVSEVVTTVWSDAVTLKVCPRICTEKKILSFFVLFSQPMPHFKSVVGKILWYFERRVSYLALLLL